MGPQRFQGLAWAGATLPIGPQGLQGVAVAAWAQGLQGVAGPTGPQWLQGVAGATGPTGPSGPAPDAIASGSTSSGETVHFVSPGIIRPLKAGSGLSFNN